MYGFKDLKFGTHPVDPMSGLQAKMFFKNGYGISVVRFRTMFGGYGSYTSNETEWEIAVLIGDEDNWTLCYDTPITDDVLGHLQEHEVSEIMEQIQKLPKIEIENEVKL